MIFIFYFLHALLFHLSRRVVMIRPRYLQWAAVSCRAARGRVGISRTYCQGHVTRRNTGNETGKVCRKMSWVAAVSPSDRGAEAFLGLRGWEPRNAMALWRARQGDGSLAGKATAGETGNEKKGFLFFPHFFTVLSFGMSREGGNSWDGWNLCLAVGIGRGTCASFLSQLRTAAGGNRRDGVWKARATGNRVDGCAGCDRADREYARRWAILRLQ